MGGVSSQSGKQNQSYGYIGGSKGLVTEQAEPTAINSKSYADWLLLCFYSRCLRLL